MCTRSTLDQCNGVFLRRSWFLGVVFEFSGESSHKSWGRPIQAANHVEPTSCPTSDPPQEASSGSYRFEFGQSHRFYTTTCPRHKPCRMSSQGLQVFFSFFACSHFDSMLQFLFVQHTSLIAISASPVTWIACHHCSRTCPGRRAQNLLPKCRLAVSQSPFSISAGSVHLARHLRGRLKGRSDRHGRTVNYTILGANYPGPLCIGHRTHLAPGREVWCFPRRR